jgi:hypothetical protein
MSDPPGSSEVGLKLGFSAIFGDFRRFSAIFGDLYGTPPYKYLYGPPAGKVK